MRSHNIPGLSIAIAACAAMLITSHGAAQSEPTTVLSLDVARPSVAFDDMDWSIASAVVNISLHHRLSDELAVISELPLARAAVAPGDDSFVGESSSFAFGNPYIGVATPISRGVSARIGGTLPLARSFGDDDFAVGYGVMGNFERFWTFLPDMFSLSAELEGRHDDPSGLFGSLGVGSSLVRLTENDAFGEDSSELFAHYGAGVGYRLDGTEVVADFTGLTVLTEDEGLGDERSIFFTRVGASHLIGRVRPELYVRMPINESIRDVVRYSVGVKVGVQVR